MDEMSPIENNKAIIKGKMTIKGVTKNETIAVIVKKEGES